MYSRDDWRFSSNDDFFDHPGKEEYIAIEEYEELDRKLTKVHEGIEQLISQIHGLTNLELLHRLNHLQRVSI